MLELKKDIVISTEVKQKLDVYMQLLIKWQSKINLISSDTLVDIWYRHFIDSLQLLPLSPTTKGDIIDLGTGAGFPGMVLAIAGISRIHLIESDMKKVMFLREVKRLTDANVTIHHTRIENKPIENASIILSRACSELVTLLALSIPYVSHGTICLFHKGKNYSKEIIEAKKQWKFDADIIPSITSSDGVILKLSNIQRLT